MPRNQAPTPVILLFHCEIPASNSCVVPQEKQATVKNLAKLLPKCEPSVDFNEDHLQRILSIPSPAQGDLSCNFLFLKPPLADGGDLPFGSSFWSSQRRPPERRWSRQRSTATASLSPTSASPPTSSAS